jgi:hypothetical protein
MAARYHYFLLVLICYAAASPSIQCQPRERNLRVFEDGGTIKFQARDDSPSSEPSAKLRQFLWNHWIAHRRGVVKQLGYSIEGTSSETNFFIEPGEQGGWRIAAEKKYQEMRRPDDIEEKTAGYEAYSVRRVKPGRGEPKSRSTIPRNARIPARSYRLVLFDREGRVIAEL